MDAESVETLHQQIVDLQAEVARSNAMEVYWREGHQRLFEKVYVVPKPKAVFTPGQNLNQGHWDAALYLLHRTGLLPLLDILDVREVRVVNFQTLTVALHDSFGTIDHTARAILIDDHIPFPAQLFPSTLVHESFHMHQADIGILNDHKKTEVMAYVGSAIFHFLNGDGIPVFATIANVAPPWPVAVELGAEVWG